MVEKTSCYKILNLLIFFHTWLHFVLILRKSGYQTGNLIVSHCEDLGIPQHATLCKDINWLANELCSFNAGNVKMDFS